MTKPTTALTTTAASSAAPLYGVNGRAIEETVYLGDTPIAVLKDDGDHDWDCDRNGKVFYVAADNLGAPHIITDERGRKVWQWNHAPFGDTEPVSSGNFTYDLRFPGQIADAESGLSYNMARDYNPALGHYGLPSPMWKVRESRRFVSRTPTRRSRNH